MGDVPIEVKYQVVSEHFRSDYVPQYRTSGAAGLDLHACLAEPLQLLQNVRVRVPTGIAIELPGRDMVGLVYARSGLAWRHGIGLPNGVGVIDSDYTGEIQVLLTNFSDVPFMVEPGDRIAQLVFAPIHFAVWQETVALRQTGRGSGGFGSTGLAQSQPPQA